MISIVMPVYNTGKYLEESLQSILAQSYEDFELICVDDYSDDILTKEILLKYEKMDERIKVLSMEHNIGAAEARNIGMDYVRGEYVTFLDADDIFHKELLMNSYTTIKKYDADMCVWGYREFCVINEEKKIKYDVLPIKVDSKTDGVFSVSELPENGLGLWSTAPWTKLCKKNFLMDNNIRFQTLKSSNDVFFSIMSAVHASKIVYVEGEQLLVDYRTGTGLQISANRDPRCACKAIKEILNKIRMGERLRKQMLYLFFNILKFDFRNSYNELWREESYYQIRGMLKENFNNVIIDDNTYKVLRNKIEEEDYGYGQFFLNGDFEGQLRGKKEELIKEIGQQQEIVVWGNGKRGKAFLNILDLFEYKSVMVVDNRNDSVGLFAKVGVPILHTDEIVGRKCIIVATNTLVYNDIKEMDQYRYAKIINLEIYCPVD